ncbi:hypothetical protein KRP22_014260 [Phytophthora ramorum]|nr:hypothetical protein KRP22_9139 [Phytophthora ramorum]
MATRTSLLSALLVTVATTSSDTASTARVVVPDLAGMIYPSTCISQHVQFGDHSSSFPTAYELVASTTASVTCVDARLCLELQISSVFDMDPFFLHRYDTNTPLVSATSEGYDAKDILPLIPGSTDGEPTVWWFQSNATDAPTGTKSETIGSRPTSRSTALSIGGLSHRDECDPGVQRVRQSTGDAHNDANTIRVALSITRNTKTSLEKRLATSRSRLADARSKREELRTASIKVPVKFGLNYIDFQSNEWCSLKEIISIFEQLFVDTHGASFVSDRNETNVAGMEDLRELAKEAFRESAERVSKSMAEFVPSEEARTVQLNAVEDAREAELQAKEAEVNHGVTEVVGERLRDPAADISAEIKQSLERSVKMIIELISAAVARNAQTKEEIKTEIENRGSGSSCKNITDAFTPPSLGLKSQAHHRYLHSLCMWKDHCFKMASVLGTNTITMDFHQQCKVVPRHLTVFVAVAEVVVAVGETADVLKTAGEPHRGNDTESAEVASWDGGRRQTVV